LIEFLTGLGSAETIVGASRPPFRRVDENVVFLALPLPFHEFKKNDLLDGDMPNYEEKLAQRRPAG
jgi:hypothetical protein